MKLLLLSLLLLQLTMTIFAQEYDEYMDNNLVEEEDGRYEEEERRRGMGAASCGMCVKEECVSPANCPAGVVPDRCGCCQICARTEGELCDEYPGQETYGLCGENLHCTQRKDLPTSESESICTCQVQKMVCGSDDTTYPTICALNEEAMRMRRGKPDNEMDDDHLTMEYWGPCKEAPVIISEPKDSYGPLGANLTLACEARGYPAPDITWKFVSSKRETMSLPNDDQQVSIQMRGGPEPLMVTGWAQIMALDPSYIGMYHCIATNTEGQAYAMASVGVYKGDL